MSSARGHQQPWYWNWNWKCISSLWWYIITWSDDEVMPCLGPAAFPGHSVGRQIYWNLGVGSRGGGGGGGGGYSSSSRAGRLGRTLWPQNSTSVAETEKGGQNSTMTPPTLEKGGGGGGGVNILHQYEKSAKKGGQKSTILKNIGVKILQVWKWGSKFYMLKNRGQNSTMLQKRGVNILHLTPKVEVKILHRLKKGGQKGRAYPLPKI